MTDQHTPAPAPAPTTETFTVTPAWVNPAFGQAIGFKLGEIKVTIQNHTDAAPPAANTNPPSAEE